MADIADPELFAVAAASVPMPGHASSIPVNRHRMATAADQANLAIVRAGARSWLN